MSEQNPIDVFISSTCRDLLDLRAVVSADLAEHRFRVRVSEDPTSSFGIDPGADTIQICLNNIEAATAVVCIIDRRYGTPLDAGPHAGKSATHVELLHARSLAKRNVFYFVRDSALRDFQAAQNNPDARPVWIEQTEMGRLVDFWREIEAFTEHNNLSNWYDTFHSAVDLRETIRHRLIARFPEYAGTLALAPDRLVRITFAFSGGGGGAVVGVFRNIGSGAALNLRHGMSLDVFPGRPLSDTDISGYEILAGLRDGEFLTLDPRQMLFRHYKPPNHHNWEKFKVACQYENRFGDRYRVEVPIKNTRNGFQTDGDEQFYVASGPKDKPTWTRVV